MRKWLIQIVAALAACLALGAFSELADIDTNIDTGNTLAIGLFELSLVWLLVACAGAVTSYFVRVLRRRR
jgi:hypothetical protein